MLGEYPGRRLRLRSAGADRDPRRRRRRRARDHAGARRSGNSSGGRRDDRRARQRNAAVGCVGGRRDSRRVRREAAAGHRVQVVDSATSSPPPASSKRRSRSRRSSAAACPASRCWTTAGPGLRGRSRLRIRRRRRRATSRSSSAAASRAPTPRCSFARSSAPRAMADAAATPETLRDRHGRDRAHRAAAAPRRRQTELGRRFSARRNWPTPVDGAVTAPRAWRRASPPRRLAPSSFRAKRRWGSSCPRISPVANDNYGAPQVVCCAERAQAATRPAPDRRIALSLTHDRVSASAVALAEPAVRRCRSPGGSCTAAFRCAATSSSDNLSRVYGDRVGRQTEIVRLAQAHYAHLWRLFGRVPQVPLALRRAQGGAGARREHRGRSSPRSRWARACSC